MADRLDGECPECGRTYRFTMQDVIKERTVRCAGGHSIKLKDDGHNARKAERELRKIDPKFRL